MPTGSIFYNDVQVVGTFTASSMTLPSNSVNDSKVIAGANIAASKVIHQFPISYAQAPGSAIVAATLDLHIFRTTGVLFTVEAAITGAIATGGDRTVDVDVHWGDSGTSFATALSSPIQFTNGSTLRAVSSATITTSAFGDGDLLRVVITVAGSAGAQAEGLLVTLTVQENPT